MSGRIHRQRPLRVHREAAGRPAERTIVHADMDAFYAAIEQLDRPELRGKPVIVGPKSARGVVLTASYEARPCRVGSAMPMSVALQRCPDAIVVPPRFERYREVSRSLMRVFDDFSPCVEAISLDEAFLDMSGTAHIFGSPRALGMRLKAAISNATGGLTASVGISNSKYAAKVASGYRKPDGLTIVPAPQVADWLAPQSVAALWGAGPKTQKRLGELGLTTVGDVAAADPDWLERRLGRIGRRFHALARGRDERPVESDRPTKSLSCERTLTEDTSHADTIAMHLLRAADTVAARLRRAGLVASGIRVKLKRSDFTLTSRQQALRHATDRSADLHRAAVALAGTMLDQGPFRLIGLAAYALAPRSDQAQLDLLAAATDRDGRLDRLIDEVSSRFGSGAIRRARQTSERTVLDDSDDLDFLDASSEQDDLDRGQGR